MHAQGMSHIIGKFLMMDTTLLEFTPIHVLMKKFIQGIVWFNTDVIELVIQGVLVLFMEDTMIEMLQLPQAQYTKRSRTS
jgi:hypothetical protein